MQDIKLLITGALHQSALKLFKSHPRFLVDYQPDCSRAQLLQSLKDVQVLVTRSETDVDREVLTQAAALKIVARAAVGVGNIDVDFATEKGVLVINCPGKNTNSAAELTLALLLGMLRHVPEAHDTVKKGGWDRHRFSGRELRGKRLGIVGLGNVGHRVAQFGRGFDMPVSAYDPYIAPHVFERHGVQAVKSLAELAAQVDVLSLHVPLNKETRGMVTGAVMDAMPRGSYIINAARGGLFKEKDVVERLASGQLAGAAIDTFESEPKPSPELIQHPLVWCTPHIGASTEEAQVAIGETVYTQVVKAVEGGVVDYPINLPQVGVIESPLLKTYAVLAEKLGSLVGQIIDFNPQRVVLSFRGHLAGVDHGLVRLSWAKGYLNQVMDDYISFVNAEAHLKKLGIAVAEGDDPDFASYKSALKVKILGSDGKQLTVGGVVFDERYHRISLINDFLFEVEPSGFLLLIENEDRPGVIGSLGQHLGERGINIDCFELSRNRKGGKAMALIRVDSEMSAEQLAEMKKIRHVLAVRRARL